jgi:hypothetical protein
MIRTSQINSQISAYDALSWRLPYIVNSMDAKKIVNHRYSL